jgi:hypothetical protein
VPAALVLMPPIVSDSGGIVTNKRLFRRFKVTQWILHIYIVQLVGVADYDKATADPAQTIVVKMDMAMGNADPSYIGFNRKIGIHQDTVEYANQVILTWLDEATGATQLRYHLTSGQTHIENDYFGSGIDLVIDFQQIVTTPTHMYAEVYIYQQQLEYATSVKWFYGRSCLRISGVPKHLGRSRILRPILLSHREVTILT